tara:strand:+ start:1802 stop:2752 length:951 start_codon:yes stop_codon:yes gene_type:complete
MGLLDNQNQYQYYNQIDSDGAAVNTIGDYQFTTLDNIINAFMISYVGESKLISKINRTDVQFHAMRAIQEMSYDVFRSIKSQEIEVPGSLTMMLPQDYVNYVKLVRVDSNGIERVLYPTGKTSNPFPIEQDSSGVYQFKDTTTDGNYDALQEQGDDTDSDNIVDSLTGSDTWNNYKDQTETDPYSDDSIDLEIDSRGRRYGLDPQYVQSNGTFFIDQQRGYIHFGSTLSGKTVTLKYISDGLGTDAEMVVHKFAEEAVYKCIAYGILSTRTNIPEYIVQRFKKERFAETRKAKIRLSNIKIEEFTQVLKGMSKQIK